MKKIIIGVSASLAILLAAGCTQGEKPVEDTKKVEDVQKTDKKEENKTLTSAEILDKYLAESQQMKSVHAVAQIKQSFGEEGTGEVPPGQNMTTEMSFINSDAHQLHVSMKTPSAEGKDVTLTEMYLDAEHLYMVDPSGEIWLKSSRDAYEAVAGDSMDVVKEFDKMLDFKSDFTVKEEGKNYVLTLSKGKEDIPSFIEALKASGEDTTAFEMGTVESFEYTYVIDKETFLPSKVLLKLSGTVQDSEFTSPFSVEVDTTYDQFNSVDEIVVPQEIKDNAQSFELPAQ